MLQKLILSAALIIRVIDGDTVEVNNEKIRLIGIDAPEMHGCKKSGCIPGDPIKSKQSLEDFLKGKNLEINRAGTDRFGRTLAIVKANGKDASCHQIETGNAIYVKKWDKGIECIWKLQ